MRSRWSARYRSIGLGSAAVALVLQGATALAQIRVDDSVLHTSPLSSSGISAERNRIINFIWGSAGFPSTKMPSMHRAVSSPIAHLINVQSVEALRITMDDGEYTLGYHFVPANGLRNRLVIVHEGHACYLDDGPGSNKPDGGIQRIVKALLANGYGVLALSMPRFSPPNTELGDPEIATRATTPRCSICRSQAETRSSSSWNPSSRALIT